MNKVYIAKLKASSDEVNLRREEAKVKTQHTDPRIVCDTPLTDQIEALMASLPPVQRGSCLVHGRFPSPPAGALTPGYCRTAICSTPQNPKGAQIFQVVPRVD